MNGGLGTMVRILWRTSWLAMLLWVLALAGSLIGTAAAVAGLYDTPQKIQSYADAVTSGNALLAINGHVEGINSLGGVIQDEFGFLASFLVPLLGISLVARFTRREEESGRLEPLLSGRIARHQPAMAALLVASGTIAATVVLFAVGLVVTGVPASQAVLYSLALGALAFVFATLAALLAQLMMHSRGVYGASLAVLATSYVLRGVGDATHSWVTWLSPLGWAEKAAPSGAQRWWTLAIPLVVGLVLGGAAMQLARRRDLGSARFRLGPGPARATAWLRHPLGLAVRLHRGAVLGWLAGALLLAGMMGALAQQLLDAIQGNPALADAMGMEGGSAIDGVMATTQVYLAVIATGYVVQAVGALRGEEAEGRLETQLAGSLSRARWLAAHTVAVLGGLVLIVVVASLVLAGTTALSLGDTAELGAVMGSGLAYLPAELVLAGIGLAVFGVWPRAFPVAWAAFGVVTFIAFLGPGLKLDRWVLDLAPTTHVGNPPLGEVAAGDLVALTAVGVLLLGVGFLAFRRRGVPRA